MKHIEAIKEFVRQECGKEGSKYGIEPYEYHFIPMVRYARRLAAKYGADREVVEIAAWLHDIGSIRHGRTDHHLTGAKIAIEVLSKLGYGADKTKLVSRCILNHRGSQERKRHSLEEKIIADADTLSNFDNIPGIFKAALVYENLNQGEAGTAVKDKLERKWKKLHFAYAKKLIRPKYVAVKILFK